MALKLPVYLDYNATTPVDPRVLEVMLPLFSRDFGNASSRTHRYGWKAEAVVKDAREALAEALGGRPDEIFFTSGATESDNMAVLGVARRCRPKGNHIVTSAIEHHAVLDAARQLETEGFDVTYLPPDSHGQTSVESVAEALTERTVLVSVMAANNEIGTINPVKGIGALCRGRDILFHTDAVQAFGKIPLHAEEINADLISITAHKLYGPKGAGALWVKSRARSRLSPLLFGGGQERGVRPGTLNVPGIAGFASAARIAVSFMNEESRRIRELRDWLERQIFSGVPGVRLNGHPVERLPGTLNLTFEAVDGESLLMELRDLAVSAGAACTSAAADASHVLLALGAPPASASASLRFSLGRFTTREEIKFAAHKVVTAVRYLRETGPRNLTRTPLG